MTKINDLSELKQMISQRMTKGVWTNCSLGSADFSLEIAQEKLFVENHESVLWIFRQRDTHFVANFYSKKGENIEINHCSVPIMLELPFTKEKPDLSNFHAVGFEELFVREQFVLDPLGQASQVNPTIKLDNLDYYEQIREIYQKRFKIKTACIPTELRLKADMEQGNVIGILDKGTLAGFLRFSVQAKTVTLLHLAVTREFQGKGFAKSLCNGCFEEHFDKKYMLFTADSEAKALYYKIGFQLGKYQSIVLQGENL